MEFTLRRTASGQVVLGVKGDLDLYSQQHLREVYARKLNALAGDLIIDMEHVDYLDSSGVGVLIHIYQLQKGAGKPLYFINMQSPVFKVIKLTRLDQVLKIYKSLDEVPAPGQTATIS